MAQDFVAEILSYDPLIIYTGGSSQVPWPNFNPHEVLLALSDRHVIWLNAVWWSFEDENEHTLQKLIKRTKVVKDVAPTHRMIFLANTHAEYMNFKRNGFEVYLANQNMFVGTELFKPIAPLSERTYDAVYNAVYAPYKRHYLASKVEKLLLIVRNLYRYESEVKNLLPSAEIAINRFEPPVKVNEIYNQATCGLALSSEEGAMYASIEYLLAGLPVVTTLNNGGRDLYLDGRFCKWVTDKPESIAYSVKVFEDQQIPPDFIRNETLHKMDFFRNKFIDETASKFKIDPAGIAKVLEEKKADGLISRWRPWDAESFLQQLKN